jgi:hypothetical protein
MQKAASCAQLAYAPPIVTGVISASSHAQLLQLAGHMDLIESCEQALSHDMLGLMRSAQVTSTPFTEKPVPPGESLQTPFSHTSDVDARVLSRMPADARFSSAPPAVERRLVVAASGRRGCCPIALPMTKMVARGRRCRDKNGNKKSRPRCSFVSGLGSGGSGFATCPGGVVAVA